MPIQSYTTDPSFLGVCLPAPRALPLPDNFREVETGREALEFLRLFPFDLVLLGAQIPDMTVWALAEHLADCRPWQRWAFVGLLTDAEEILCRSLKVAAIFDRMPDLEFLHQLAAERVRGVPARRRENRVAACLLNPLHARPAAWAGRKIRMHRDAR